MLDDDLRKSRSLHNILHYIHTKHNHDSQSAAFASMEEDGRGYIFEDVHYTIIPSDELDGDKSTLVCKS